MLDQVLQCIQGRRSVRAFLPDDIPKTTIMQILTAGTSAPSAGNAQCWFFYVVRNKNYRAVLSEAALDQQFVAQAPVVIVVCADLERAADSYRSRGETLYCVQETAAAIQNMLLTIHALGLGSCWVGAFDETMVTDLLSLPSSLRPVALLPVGKSAEKPRVPGRRDLATVVREVE
jgi:nitroreductase